MTPICLYTTELFCGVYGVEVACGQMRWRAAAFSSVVAREVLQGDDRLIG